MRRKSMRTAATIVVAFFGGLGHTASALGAEEEQAVSANPATAQTVDVGTLPPQQLESAQCGLFLWTNSSEPRLVFVSVTGGSARMVVNGENLSLARNAAEGQEFYGQFETQNFHSPEMNVALNMDVERRPAIVDGAVIPRATLRITEASGWETVIPVGGLIGCGTA